jgi:post-GPI attachment to proteins factor 3
MDNCCEIIEELLSLLDDRNCVQQCVTEGVAGGTVISHCTNETVKGVWYTKEPLYTQWRQLNCKADCQYHCMMQREQERRLQGLKPVKYHGKWPFLRVFVFQVSIIFYLCLFCLFVFNC